MIMVLSKYFLILQAVELIKDNQEAKSVRQLKKTNF